MVDEPEPVSPTKSKRRERAKKSIRQSIADARPAIRRGDGDGDGGGSGGASGSAPTKPERQSIEVRKGDLPWTTRAVRDLISETRSDIYVRDRMLVRVVRGPGAWGRDPAADVPDIRLMNTHDVIRVVHEEAQPFVWRKEKGKRWEKVDATLPKQVADDLLGMQGDQRVPVLRGITTAPLLTDDGSIVSARGYDPASGFWCVPPAGINVQKRPTRRNADAALLYLRDTIRTFPFADADRIAADGAETVDLTKPPGADETAMVAGEVTATVRASLDLAPGLAITGPTLSGSGAGKGLLARLIAMVAFGVSPRPFTPGGERGELEKRLAVDLIAGGQVVMLDNANGADLRSDALASLLTESPIRVRVLGESRMAELDGRPWVVVCGNGLRIGEDLARRMLLCELDPRCENPETRQFEPGLLRRIKADRPRLLSAILTIWRWGRQNQDGLVRGAPLGTFETWCDWVRDPLLTLGCRDPVARLSEIKAGDPLRNRAGELFDAWWAAHKDYPMKAAELAEAVITILDPKQSGRQYQASQLQKFKGMRAAGYVLTAVKSAARWATWRYVLTRSDGAPDAAPPPDAEGTL